jgi:hypothetical protein
LSLLAIARKRGVSGAALRSINNKMAGATPVMNIQRQLFDPASRNK